MVGPAGGDRLQRTGDKVRDVASGAAQRGWADLREWLALQPLKEFGFTTTVGGVISAVVAVLLAIGLSALLRRALRRYGRRHPSANQASLYTVSRLLHYALLAIGALLALNLAGLSLDKFTLFVGALGVGLGFGLRAIFANFISGLLLLFDHSLKVGDFVELDADLRGTVRSINMRSTRITTNDNIDVMVPNSEFVDRRLINWTHGSVHRRIRVPFRTAFDVDKELVKKAAMEAAGRVQFTLAMEGEDAPQVWLTRFGEWGSEYLLVVWLTEEAARRNAAIHAAYLWELDTALKKYAIDVPYPRNDMHIRSLFGLSGKDAVAAWRGQAIASEPPGAGSSAATPQTGGVLAPTERAALARNDAQLDTQRRIQEDAARAARDRNVQPRQDASAPDGKGGRHD